MEGAVWQAEENHREEFRVLSDQNVEAATDVLMVQCWRSLALFPGCLCHPQEVGCW